MTRFLLKFLFFPVMLGVFVLSGWSKPAHAHPHAWIDIKNRVVFNEGGQITAIKEDWVFDEGYTVFVLDGLSKGIPHILTPSGMQKVAHKIMKNLAPYSYFTRIKVGGKGISISHVSDISADMQGRRLHLAFTAQLEKPEPAAGFSYETFDPTYYIEMLHADAKDAIVLEYAPKGCSFHVIKPHPAIEDVVRAANIDQTAQSDGKLGEIFAEKVLLSCP